MRLNSKVSSKHGLVSLEVWYVGQQMVVRKSVNMMIVKRPKSEQIDYEEEPVLEGECKARLEMGSQFEGYVCSHHEARASHEPASPSWISFAAHPPGEREANLA